MLETQSKFDTIHMLIEWLPNSKIRVYTMLPWSRRAYKIKHGYSIIFWKSNPKGQTIRNAIFTIN
jgi:hypothetical protein